MFDLDMDKMIGLGLLDRMLDDKCSPERARLIKNEIKSLEGKAQMIACARYMVEFQGDDVPELVRNEMEKMVNEMEKIEEHDRKTEELKQKSEQGTLTDQDRIDAINLLKEMMESKKTFESAKEKTKEYQASKGKTNHGNRLEELEKRYQDGDKTVHFRHVKADTKDFIKEIENHLNELHKEVKNLNDYHQKGAPFLLTKMKELTYKLTPLMVIMSKFGINDSCLFRELDKIKDEIKAHSGPDMVDYEAFDQRGNRI